MRCDVELLPQVHVQVDELAPLHLEFVRPLGDGLLSVLQLPPQLLPPLGQDPQH